MLFGSGSRLHETFTKNQTKTHSSFSMNQSVIGFVCLIEQRQKHIHELLLVFVQSTRRRNISEKEMDVLQHGKFIEPNHPQPTKQESFRFFKIQIKKGKPMNKLHTAKKWWRHHGRPCLATLKKRWIGGAWRWERLDVVVLPAAQQQHRGHRIRRSRLPVISRRGQRFLMAVIYGANEWKRRG
jgi:hypothetical protein